MVDVTPPHERSAAGGVMSSAVPRLELLFMPTSKWKTTVSRDSDDK